MKPISKRLLIHEATAKTVSGMDSDRNPTYSTETSLSKIRISVYNSNVLTGDGLNTSKSMQLFFDCNASRPVGFVPAKDMVITFNSVNYTIRKVTPCYIGNNSKVHHYEAELV